MVFETTCILYTRLKYPAATARDDDLITYYKTQSSRIKKKTRFRRRQHIIIFRSKNSVRIKKNKKYINKQRVNVAYNGGEKN